MAFAMSVGAAVCAAAFIVVLAVSAYWDRSIVLLHIFEAVPYAIAAVLCVRQRTFGYALAAASGAFWLWIASTQTSFVRNGFERVEMLLRSGRVDRWDQFIAVPAALATGGLIVFSLGSYLLAPKRPLRDVAAFVIAAASVTAFFSAIFATTGPQYLPLIKRAFGF
jgi:hypothetical protein